MLPPVTPQLVQRMAQVMESLTRRAWARLLAGTVPGAEERQFGGARARLIAGARGPGWWNRAIGLTPADSERVPALAAYYRDADVPAWADVLPTTFDASLGSALAGAGAFLTGVSSVVYGLAVKSDVSLPPGMAIELAGPDRAGLAAEIWAGGFEVPAEHRQHSVQIRRAWFELEENRVYLAVVDGKPVAMAALFMSEGIGFLNVGATLRPYRGRGIHSALVRARLAQAAAAGCDLVIGHVGFAGQSQNNEERLGFRIAYLPLQFSLHTPGATPSGGAGGTRSA